MQKNKQKILVFIDWFLPCYKAGGPITSISNLINHLNNEFEFFIITSDTDYQETKPYDNIISNKWVDFSLNVKVFYISDDNLNRNFIRKLIKNTGFDVAYINGIYSYFFSILPLLVVKSMNKRVIVSARGMLSEHAFSRKSLKKKLFLTLMKIRSLYNNVEFHATNDNEKQDILRVIGKKVVVVIPNLPRKIKNIFYTTISKSAGDVRLVSIARISQEKNTKFALEILLQITQGSIVFDIYGSINDENYWNECLQIISKMPSNVIVNYKGTINTKNVIDTFSNYHFSFMPSLGENFGHSLLESMIASTPIITSKNTPWQNLEKLQAGWDIDLSNKNKFVDVLNNLIEQNQVQYDNFTKNTFNFAKSVIDNNVFVEKYIKMFNNE
ncbi:MAG: glycosyltransferase [Bacteroidales bacterium]|nr:glycosyltransferase [Bacteroidales bacterium]